MKKFKKIYIEITNVCNLTCHFCPQTKRKMEFMELDTFSHILKQIKPFTDYIYLHVKGEPLLHPKLDQLLDISYEHGMKVNITTNGTFIPKVKDKIMMKPALRQINLSLHSLSGHLDFKHRESYIKEMVDFTKEVNEKTNVYVSLRLWNLELDDLANLEKKRNRDLLQIIEKEFNLTYQIEEKVTPGSSVKVSERIYLHQDHRFKWPDLDEQEVGEVGFCFGLRDHVGILVDGTVVPCCLDGEGVINLGNIKDQHFSEIIACERACNMYHGFSNRKAVEELCKKCGYRTKMNG